MGIHRLEESGGTGRTYAGKDFEGLRRRKDLAGETSFISFGQLVLCQGIGSQKGCGTEQRETYPRCGQGIMAVPQGENGCSKQTQQRKVPLQTAETHLYSQEERKTPSPLHTDHVRPCDASAVCACIGPDTGSNRRSELVRVQDREVLSGCDGTDTADDGLLQKTRMGSGGRYQRVLRQLLTSVDDG